MAVPYLPIGISAAVLGAMLLWGRDSEAATNGGDMGPGPAPGPNGGGTGRFPADAALAVVNITTGEGNMNVRAAPSPNAPLRGSVPNGSTVAVLTGEIPEENLPANAPNRWRRILTRGGVVGYSRFVGPAGETNFRPTGTVPWPGAGEMREVRIITAGAPAAIGQYPYAYPYGYPGAYPGAYPGLGWAAWGSGFSPRVEIIGQAPSGQLMCANRAYGCGLNPQLGSIQGAGRLPFGTIVEVIGPEVPHPTNAAYGNMVRVRSPRGEGWVMRSELGPVPTAPAPAPYAWQQQVRAPFARRFTRDVAPGPFLASALR